MSDGRQFDEPDLETHVRMVLEDYKAGQLDGIDEAVEAIMERPELKLVRINRRIIGPKDVEAS